MEHDPPPPAPTPPVGPLAPDPARNDAGVALRTVRRRFSWILAGWSVGSIVLGLPLWLLAGDSPFWSPVALHFWAWGAIDLLFALPGIRQARHAARVPLSPQQERLERDDAARLLKALTVSHKLNWLYLAVAGALYLWALVAESPALSGHATGVFLQGGFLFLFDRGFDAELRRTLAETPDGPLG